MQFSGNTYEASVDKELVPQLEILFLVLSQVEPSRLIHGFRFQVGWSLYYLDATNDHRFVILSPDYANDPFSMTTTDLTLPLWVQSEQTYLLRDLQVDGVTTKFSDKILLSADALDSPNICLQRTGDVEPDDSGWYVSSTDVSAHSDIYAMYTYELLQKRREFMKVLALPVGYMSIFEGSDMKLVINEHNEEVLVNMGK